MSLKGICPHCGHELDINVNRIKTIDNAEQLPTAASTLRRFKGPIYATAIAIISIVVYCIHI